LSEQEKWTIVFDGGSRGNPGAGYGSYVLAVNGKVRLHESLDFADRGPKVTNNEAEYLTLINALTMLDGILKERAATTRVEIFGDSMLVISQLKGVWKVKKDSLRPYHAEASQLLRRFGNVSLQWHERSNSVEILGH
jgi:ribonuclease HI